MTGKAVATSKPSPPRKGGQIGPRISKKTAQAVRFMVATGCTADKAAQEIGMNREAFRKALAKPHVKAYQALLFQEVRDNGAARAYLKVNNLMDVAASERVQFDAARWVAGVDGISPIQKIRGVHNHRHDFGGFAFDPNGRAESGWTNPTSVDDAEEIDGDQ